MDVAAMEATPRLVVTVVVVGTVARTEDGVARVARVDLE